MYIFFRTINPVKWAGHPLFCLCVDNFIEHGETLHTWQTRKQVFKTHFVGHANKNLINMATNRQDTLNRGTHRKTLLHAARKIDIVNDMIRVDYVINNRFTTKNYNRHLIARSNHRIMGYLYGAQILLEADTYSNPVGAICNIVWYMTVL